MENLLQKVDYMILLHSDNQSAACLVENLIFQGRMKHMEVYCHFIRGKVLKKNTDD